MSLQSVGGARGVWTVQVRTANRRSSGTPWNRRSVLSAALTRGDSLRSYVSSNLASHGRQSLTAPRKYEYASGHASSEFVSARSRNFAFIG
jgi:hypothetical protein